MRLSIKSAISCYLSEKFYLQEKLTEGHFFASEQRRSVGIRTHDDLVLLDISSTITIIGTLILELVLLSIVVLVALGIHFSILELEHKNFPSGLLILQPMAGLGLTGEKRKHVRASPSAASTANPEKLSPLLLFSTVAVKVSRSVRHVTDF